VGFCEHGDEPSASITWGKFPDYLGKYHLLRAYLVCGVDDTLMGWWIEGRKIKILPHPLQFIYSPTVTTTSV
jgi:hypothetical protein